MNIQLLNYNANNTLFGHKTVKVTEVKAVNPSLLQTKLTSRPDLIFHPSFGISKANLGEYALACANTYKTPLEKLKTEEGLKDWFKYRLGNTADISKYKRKNAKWYNEHLEPNLSEWHNYLQAGNFYNEKPEESLIIWDGITKELSENTNDMPPPFDEGILKYTLEQIKIKMQKDPKGIVNFNKQYWDNLFLKYTKDLPDTCWIKIGESGLEEYINDKKQLNEDIKKVRALSRKNWCTRDCDAPSKLYEGPFYIYLENKKPKLGITSNHCSYRSAIGEIAGEKNNERLPVKYAKVIKDFIRENKFDNELTIEYFEELEAKIADIKTKFGKEIREGNYKNVLEYLGYEPKVLENGMLELHHFNQPEDFALSDIDIDEDDLFKHVGGIRGNAQFQFSEVTNLGNCKYINGEAHLNHSHVENLGDLEYARVLSAAKPVSGKLKRVDILDIGGYCVHEIPSIMLAKN